MKILNGNGRFQVRYHGTITEVTELFTDGRPGNAFVFPEEPDGSGLYYLIYGRLVRVTAMFGLAADANAHMARPGSHDALLATSGGLHILANEYDKGIKP